MENMLKGYIDKLTELAGSNINCGSILNWFEVCNIIHRQTDGAGWE